MSCFAILLLLSALTLPLADASFEPWSYTEKDLFPSAIISTATVDWNGKTETAEETPIFGDENGWLGVVLTDVVNRSNVSVEISIDGYLKPSKWTGVIEDRYQEIRIVPKAKWDYEALRKVREQTPVAVTFKVSVNGEVLDEQTESYIIRSINDCPFYVRLNEEEENEEFEDLSWIFAAYVNENHPWIDEILKEALQSELVDSFTGYQSGIRTKSSCRFLRFGTRYNGAVSSTAMSRQRYPPSLSAVRQCDSWTTPSMLPKPIASMGPCLWRLFCERSVLMCI